MDQKLVSPRKITRGKTSTLASRIAILEADNALLRQTNDKLQQQLQDSEIELKATIDEFLRAEEETDLAKRETERAKEEAERANTVKSAFLASMSHELRTPLNAVLNFSQFISSGMLGSVNDEQIDMLEKITNSGKHLLNLINDVLDISKIESGSLRLFVEANVDLAQEVKTVADTGRALLKDKAVELKVNIPADVPKITADRRRIRQVLLNLVSNACKFTETGEVAISIEADAQEIRVIVKDTGPGIAAQDHNTIFEAFRQTEAGIRQGSGTGLGLAISRRLAEAHNGKLWVESQLGAGATFFVALPLNAVVPAAKPEVANAK